MERACLVVLIALPVLLAAPRLHAQETSSQLFEDGVQLFQQGEVDKACSKFEQSYALDEATGTLFNLASCHEKQGKLWNARQEYEQLAKEMGAAGKADKAALAEKLAAAVEARLPKLRLQFPAGSNVASIDLDSKPLASANWNQPIPVDSGPHRLRLQAPHMQPRTLHVDAEGEGSVTTVSVPVLSAERPAVSESPIRTRAVSEKPSRADRGTQADWWTPKRKAGALVGGVGVIGIGVGAVFGIEAISKKGRADDACGTGGDVCRDASHAQAAKSEIHDAQSTATVSTISFGLGIAALAVGSYLWFSSSTPAPAESALRIAPTAGPRSGGVVVDGRF